MKKWTKDSWRAYPAKHIPEYPDTTELAKVESNLSKYPPIVFAAVSYTHLTLPTTPYV